MEKRSISAVLPARAGSQRVVNKNIRPFGPYRYGLMEVKLRQLLNVRGLTEVLVDTDLPEISTLTSILKKQGLAVSKLRIEERDPRFATGATTTDDLIRYIASKVKTIDVMWVHATQPFADEGVLSRAIDIYRNALKKGFDSLMSVTQMKTFVWDCHGPVNYSRTVEKWPRSQTLPEWFVVNSAVFITPSVSMRATGDRIGASPYLFEVDPIQGLDIDEEADFRMAEWILAGRSFQGGAKGPRRTRKNFSPVLGEVKL